MNLQERELSVDNYRKLGLRDLEQLYTLRIIPHVTKSLATICTLLRSGWDEHEIPEYLIHSTKLMQQFVQAYTDHSSKEVTLLSMLLNRQADTLSVVIPQLKESHNQMRQLLKQVSELGGACDNSGSCSSLHKLGYAYINNLRQDISRLFFLEEEYLFPRLSLLSSKV
jgi:iron-sulfur cluster repair protein YtfE (RIC family)